MAQVRQQQYYRHFDYDEFSAILSRFRCPLHRQRWHRHRPADDCLFGHTGLEPNRFPPFICALHPLERCRARKFWIDERVHVCIAGDNITRLHVPWIEFMDLDQYLLDNWDMITDLFGPQPLPPQQQQSRPSAVQARQPENSVLENNHTNNNIREEVEEDDSEDQCAICFESVSGKYPNDRGQNPDRFAVLDPCGHWFCVGCVRRMQRPEPAGGEDYYELYHRNIKCPMCRVWSSGIRFQPQIENTPEDPQANRSSVPSPPDDDEYEYEIDIKLRKLYQDLCWLFGWICWLVPRLFKLAMAFLFIYVTVCLVTVVVFLVLTVFQAIVSPFVTAYQFLEPILAPHLSDAAQGVRWLFDKYKHEVLPDLIKGFENAKIVVQREILPGFKKAFRKHIGSFLRVLGPYLGDDFDEDFYLSFFQ